MFNMVSTWGGGVPESKGLLAASAGDVRYVFLKMLNEVPVSLQINQLLARVQDHQR